MKVQKIIIINIILSIVGLSLATASLNWSNSFSIFSDEYRTNYFIGIIGIIFGGLISASGWGLSFLALYLQSNNPNNKLES
jgi:hypothetical protein